MTLHRNYEDNSYIFSSNEGLVGKRGSCEIAFLAKHILSLGVQDRVEISPNPADELAQTDRDNKRRA